MILMVNANFVFAASKMENMTSAKKAKEIATKLPTRNDLVGKHSFGIGIGQTFLLSDFKKNGRDEISPDLFYSYSASYSFNLLANFHYWKYNQSDRSTTLSGLSFAIKSKLFLIDSFSPFVLGGLGFYLPRTKSENEKSDSQLVFGTTLGAGAELLLNTHYKLGLLFQYHNPFDVSQDNRKDLEGSYYKLLMSFFYIF